MGNTLTCCVSPSASPKLGGRKGPTEASCESETYEAAAGDAAAVGVTPAPAAAEPSELDLGAGEGHHLQHISDREMPEGESGGRAGSPERRLRPRAPRAPSCPGGQAPGSSLSRPRAVLAATGFCHQPFDYRGVLDPLLCPHPILGPFLSGTPHLVLWDFSRLFGSFSQEKFSSSNFGASSPPPSRCPSRWH